MAATTGTDADRPVLRMALATVCVGVAAGVSGAVLTLLLHLVQHVAFGYTENTFLIGVQRASGLRRVLAMAVGGVVVGLGWWWHRSRVDVEDVSVTHALRSRPPRLPVLATTSDALLQIVAVGTGASLGREGAPRQVGAALALRLAARFGVDAEQRRLLLACGAGAGLAAVYNVPLGGALFSLELLLRSVSWRAVLPALATSVIATVVAWPVLGDAPTYRMPPVHVHAAVLVWALVFGPAAGVVGVGFTRLMSLARTRAPEGAWVAITIPVAFAAVGALAIAYPQLLGNGKGPASLAFDADVAVGLAIVLVVLKPVATAVCLGSGAIGGLLTPALATGAMLGLFGGHVWDALWPGASLREYALVGAAALLAVTQRAPLTAIVLTLEFVGGALPVLPAMTLAVAGAALVGGLLDPDRRPGRGRVAVRTGRSLGDASPHS